MHDQDPLHRALKSLDNLQPPSPPPGLRESILRRAATEPRLAPLSTRRMWIAAAASLLLLAANVGTLLLYQPSNATPATTTSDYLSPDWSVADLKLYD